MRAKNDWATKRGGEEEKSLLLSWGKGIMGLIFIMIIIFY